MLASPMLATSLLPVVIDTREQRGWTFSPDDCSVVRQCLPTGDYSVVGLEQRLTIERKNLGDYVNTLFGDWLRFRKQLIRMAGFEVAVIVVEADLSDILEHRYESKAEPASVLGRTNGIYLDHGVPVLFWGARGQCQDMAARFLKLAAKKLRD